MAAFSGPLVRGWSGGLFLLMASAVVFPLIFISGTHLNRGTMPYFLGALAASALIFLGSAATARAVRPNVVFLIEKLALSERDYEAVLQPAVEVQNNEGTPVVMHDWRARLVIAQATHRLRRVIGQARIEQGLELPFLDRMGPLPPGPTLAHIQFAVEGMRQAQVDDAMESGSPVVLTVEVQSGRHWWQAEVDLSALPRERRPVGDQRRVGPVEGN